LGVSFPAVRSLTLLSLADPLLSVASTSWMSAVQRKQPFGIAAELKRGVSTGPIDGKPVQRLLLTF